MNELSLFPPALPLQQTLPPHNICFTSEADGRQSMMDQRWAAVFDQNPVCAALLSTSGKVLDVNDAMLQCIEVKDKNALLSRNSAALLTSDGRSQYYALLAQAAANQPAKAELRMRTFKGFIRWMDIQILPVRNSKGSVSSLTIFATDITARKTAAMKLAASEQQYRAMVQNGCDIVAILDKNNKFSYVSPSTFQFSGYQPEDLIGQSALIYIHPDDVDLVAEQLSMVTSAQKQVRSEITYRFRHRLGHWLWIESKAINLLHEESVKGIIINARDISHHKHLEAQLALELRNRQKEITNAVIKAQERERSQLGQELHDNVNQVLTTIKLYNEMLLEGIGDRNHLLPRSIQHLQDCINEIRSISKRLSAPTLGKISLRDSIGELVQSINLTNRLQISYHIEGLEGIVISQDLHLAIYRIIQEQLNNILKYAAAQFVVINISNGPSALHLTVTDDGQGFDTTQKSSGIGITNMKTRAESNNGIFRICSRPSEGCTVDVLFPAL